MEAKKKPAKNDKTERNINDFAIDLMGGPTPELSDLQAAIVEREIRYGCEGACVDGFGNRNSPRRRSSPRGFVFQPWLRQRPIPSPNRNTSFFLPSPIISGTFLLLGTHQRQAARTNILCWQSANLGQLDVYISKFLDSFPTGEKGLPVLPHLKAGHHDLHLLV